MNKTKRSEHRRHDHATPVVVSSDELAIISDDELISYAHTLFMQRSDVERCGCDPSPWEIELSWTQRELKIRSARREAHDAYVKAEDESFVDENDLPAADLDNSRFTNIMNNYYHRLN